MRYILVLMILTLSPLGAQDANQEKGEEFSSTCWVTLFGTDFALSVSSGNLNLAIGEGGFFRWFEAFAEREFTKKQFGMGFDPHGPLKSEFRFLPTITPSRKGWPRGLILPIWLIIVPIVVGAIAARRWSISGLRKNDSEAEPPR